MSVIWYWFIKSAFDVPITKRYISICVHATPIFCAVLDDIASTMLNRRFVEELFLRHQGPAINDVSKFFCIFDPKTNNT